MRERALGIQPGHVELSHELLILPDGRDPARAWLGPEVVVAAARAEDDPLAERAAAAQIALGGEALQLGGLASLSGQDDQPAAGDADEPEGVRVRRRGELARSQEQRAVEREREQVQLLDPAIGIDDVRDDPDGLLGT